MHIIHRLTIAIGALLLLPMAGCCLFLPAGDPPTGTITNNPAPRRELSIDEAATSLGLTFLSALPGETVTLAAADSEARTVLLQVFGQASGIAGVTVAPTAPWQLAASRSAKESVTLTLRKLNAPSPVTIWQEEVHP